MIPRMIHQVWVGPDPMPQAYRDYGESWRRHHPDWEMRLWTEENLPTDFRKEAYERLRIPSERSDVLRYEVLLRFGGVYVDADIECLRSIEPLLEGLDFFTAYNNPRRVSSAIIGATPGHPIIERAVREIRPVTEYGIDKWATGPAFFTKLIRQYPRVRIYPQEYFHMSTPGRDAYAVNHHARSWKDSEDHRAALIKAEQQLTQAQERIEELERRRWRNRVGRPLRAIRRRGGSTIGMAFLG